MKSGETPRKILIVDDDLGLLRLIAKALQRVGFATDTAASGQDAIVWLSKNHADLLLLDLKLEDIQGKELIDQLKQVKGAPPFIIITGQGDERVAVEMMKRGARDYLVKDVEFLQFVPEVVANVMEQIETERRLAAAEEQVNLIQSVVEHGFSAVLIASPDLPDPEIVYINPAFTKLLGSSADQMLGQPLSRLMGLTAVQEQLRQGIPESEAFMERSSPYQSAAGERWAEWRIGPVKDKAGRITNWLLILRDVTERKRLEKEILEINDRVQRRIGQDLHDGLCQQLAGIEFMSQVLEQKIAAISKSDAARIGEIAGHVREAISQTRLMARGLSPILLDPEGLRSGLQELALNTESMFGVSCLLECDAPVLIEDQAAATHLFRIAQEAVANALKHGKATRISIYIKREAEKLVLKITDDGRGFSATSASQKGMGLQVMQSRAGMIGGTLDVANHPAGGVCVTCTVTLAESSRKIKNENGRKTQKA
ncbi:MAG: response regulator [Verrucomicrobiota bacterium]